MMEVGKLNGVKVITSNSFTLGEIEGSNVDTKSWRLTHLKIELTDEATRELGFSKPMFGSIKVCLPIENVAGFGDVVTLKNSLMDLKGTPECKPKR
jgi:sporulation protein YlmC with PRC-barrel domain